MSVESWKVILACTRTEAEALNHDSPELALLDPPPVLMMVEPDETKPDDWEAHVYFEGEPDPAHIAIIQKLIPSAAQQKPMIERLPDEDWVTVSQQGLDPVKAGRFYVHTASNKGSVPKDSVSFQIEASLAFGTGGHATTKGCLLILDQLKGQGKRFDHIIDIGTGTGLLAFAASHLWPRAYVTASDIDPVSVNVTAENAKINGLTVGQSPGHVALCAASGTDHDMIQRRAPYDLLIANILAGPLMELAPAFAEILSEGGTLILAGLLKTQQDSVVRTYRQYGLRLVSVQTDPNWPALCLTKRRSYAWKRPVRTSGRTSQAEGDFGTW